FFSRDQPAWAEAEADCAEALKRRPKDWETWYLHGVTLSSLGRPKDALAAFDQAIQLRPEVPALWEARAHHRAQDGQYEKAAGDFAHLLEGPRAGHDYTWGYSADWVEAATLRHLALAQLGAGREEDYRRTCARLLARLPRPSAASSVTVLAAAPTDAAT